jgi:flagellar basal-body rod modification protein FlgD
MSDMTIYSSPIAGDVISNDSGKSTIEMEGFLKILAAELQNQDPLNAGDSTQYLQQMLQFTSLEQMENLSKSVENMFLSQKFEQGSLMIGKTAKIALNGGTYKTGQVSSVNLADGKVYVVVDGDKYAIDDVVELSPGESE